MFLAIEMPIARQLREILGDYYYMVNSFYLIGVFLHSEKIPIR